MSNMIYLTISREQGKKLLTLFDSFEVCFGSETPYWIRGISQNLRKALYPDSFV